MFAKLLVVLECIPRLSNLRRRTAKPKNENTVTTQFSPSHARIDALPVEVMFMIFRIIWLRAAHMKSALCVLSQVSRRWNDVVREMSRTKVHRTVDQLRPLPVDARALSYLDCTVRGSDTTFLCLLGYISASPGLETVSLHNLSYEMPPELCMPQALSKYAAPHVARLTLSIRSIWPSRSLTDAYSHPGTYLDGAYAIAKVTMVHFDVLFPRLQYLKLDSPTPLRLLTPYLPRTLRCLVLEAPPARLLQDRSTLLPWGIISALGHGLFARTLRAYGVQPEIIVRGGLQEPAMWQDVLSVCTTHGVVLQRVVAYEASRVMDKAGSMLSLIAHTAWQANAPGP
jgi:hypothetical protein